MVITKVGKGWKDEELVLFILLAALFFCILVLNTVDSEIQVDNAVLNHDELTEVVAVVNDAVVR